MLIDITLRITKEMINSANDNEKMSIQGHLGTHFDVMDKELPLDYTYLKAVCFDVSKVSARDIEISDITATRIEKGMFVAFYTGFIEREGYASQKYFHEHPQLSMELIDLLLEKEIYIIGVDFAGVRRGAQHTPTDKYCADKGTFIVENLCNLQALAKYKGILHISTFPVSYANMTGLPCRVIARLE